MRKLILLAFAPFFLLLTGGCDEDGNPLGGLDDQLTETDVVAGLKQALEVGTDSTVNQLTAVDGYLGNELIRLALPPEAAEVESAIRGLGAGALVDEFVLKMNRAAEDAATEAAPIFKNAITNITVDDGWGILRGVDTAATHYLRVNTYNELTGLYAPKIENSMSKVGAQQAWQAMTQQYNQLPLVDPIETDISRYITTRALDGLFVTVGQKEQGIRNDVSLRVTDLLKEVFAEQDDDN